METFMYPIGDKIHYYVDSSEQCHPAYIASPLNVIDGVPHSCDLIQLDAVNALGVIVPLRHDGIMFEETATTEGTCHYTCPR